MAIDYPIYEHDVLVIGAGGAGLRAAIEASAAGVSVGLVCKSLLGKAHTVMAEGGIAAALAHVDARDSWKVHFADTMRGGQYVNNWRMAQLHAQEAPARVKELEAWGAVFDRTADGRILQRNFGGHKYPPPGPCRGPHRPGTYSHLARLRHPSRHQRVHRTHGLPSVQRWGANCRGHRL
jgi:succinate dehydrogenase / fumarate reductase flavoprotein subunit